MSLQKILLDSIKNLIRTTSASYFSRISTFSLLWSRVCCVCTVRTGAASGNSRHRRRQERSFCTPNSPVLASVSIIVVRTSGQQYTTQRSLLWATPRAASRTFVPATGACAQRRGKSSTSRNLRMVHNRRRNTDKQGIAGPPDPRCLCKLNRRREHDLI